MDVAQEFQRGYIEVIGFIDQAQVRGAELGNEAGLLGAIPLLSK